MQDTFSHWLDALAVFLEHRYGVPIADLSADDCWGWFVDGLAPEEAARLALRTWMAA